MKKIAHRKRPRANKTTYSSFKLTSNENAKVFLLFKIENEKISIKGCKPFFEDWFNENDIKRIMDTDEHNHPIYEFSIDSSI